jgi:hypothetical protein
LSAALSLTETDFLIVIPSRARDLFSRLSHLPRQNSDVAPLSNSLVAQPFLAVLFLCLGKSTVGSSFFSFMLQPSTVNLVELQSQETHKIVTMELICTGYARMGSRSLQALSSLRPLRSPCPLCKIFFVFIRGSFEN